MNLKLALLFLSVFSISTLFSQEETLIIQRFSNNKKSIENTLLINKNTITFKNEFFSIVQIREEYAYQIYSHRLRCLWQGNINDFNSDYSVFLEIILDEKSEHLSEKTTKELKDLIKSKNAILIKDSIVENPNMPLFSKKAKTNNKVSIADKECVEYKFYEDTIVKAEVYVHKVLSKKDNEDLIKFWKVINIINQSTNTDVSFNLSFLEKGNSLFPMKAIIYKNNTQNILKEETVDIIVKQKISKCECESTKGYSNFTLVDLLMGAKELNSK